MSVLHNKKIIYVLAGGLLSTYPSIAFSATHTFSGTLALTDTVPPVAWCDSSDRMDVVPFHVTQSGVYTLSNMVSTGRVYAQVDPNSNNSYTPLLDINTDGPSWVAASGNLSAGTTYYMITLSACSSASFPYAYSYDLTGPGNIVLDSASTTPNSIPTLSEWGLLILSGLLGIGTFLGFRRQSATRTVV